MRVLSAAVSMLLTLLVLRGAASPAPSADPVGFVRSAQGAAVVRRAGEELVAREGLVLVEGDVVRTAPDGRVGVLFHDDTRVGLGPASEVKIIRFRFQPKRDDLAFVLHIARGAASYTSGKIPALGPPHVRILRVDSHGKDAPLVQTGDNVPEPRNRRVEVTVR
jgi:hypothetical protein